MAYLATSSYLALSLVALNSIPAIRSIAHRISRARDYEPIQLAKEVYRDEDGEATDESLRAFSDKWQRIAIALFSVAGFSVTLALAVLATLKLTITNSTLLVWLQFGVWVCTNPDKGHRGNQFETILIANSYFLDSARYSSCCFLH